MNGKELKSFSLIQILTKVGYRKLAEISKLTNFQVCLIHCEALKVSQNDQIQM